MRDFVGIDLGNEPAPDETTICKFRYLMEKIKLGDQLFHLVIEYLHENGIKISRGTNVYASIISAPSSTKSKDNKRGRDMHQARKGNQWYFGMKAFIGLDRKTTLIHSVAETPAKVHGSVVLGDPLRGDETRVWGDSVYPGK